MNDAEREKYAAEHRAREVAETVHCPHCGEFARDHTPKRCVDALKGEVLRVRGLINRDRTGLAKAIDEMVKEAQGRLWIVEGRGSYEWDDDGYRKETGFALHAVIELGKKALNDSGRLADSAFHPERESV